MSWFSSQWKSSNFISNYLKLRHLKTKSSSHGSSLIGSHFINSNSLTYQENQSILWTALDLKHASIQTNKNLKLLNDDSFVTILLNQPFIKYQIAMEKAVKLLGGNVTVVIDQKWEEVPNIENLACVLSQVTDVIVAAGTYPNICKLASKSAVPVINLNSCTFLPLQCFADIMSFQEHFGHIKGLNIAFIGSSGPLLNTYLLTCAQFGINLKYISDKNPVFELLTLAVEESHLQGSELKVCNNPSDAFKNANVIVVPEGSNKFFKTHLSEIHELASDNWMTLNNTPKEKSDIYENLIERKRRLTCISIENLEYISMAVILKLLTNYVPKINMPNFEEVENGAQETNL